MRGWAKTLLHSAHPVNVFLCQPVLDTDLRYPARQGCSQASDQGLLLFDKCDGSVPALVLEFSGLPGAKVDTLVGPVVDVAQQGSQFLEPGEVDATLDLKAPKRCALVNQTTVFKALRHDSSQQDLDSTLDEGSDANAVADVFSDMNEGPPTMSRCAHAPAEFDAESFAPKPQGARYNVVAGLVHCNGVDLFDLLVIQPRGLAGRKVRG